LHLDRSKAALKQLWYAGADVAKLHHHDISYMDATSVLVSHRHAGGMNIDVHDHNSIGEADFADYAADSVSVPGDTLEQLIT
jgi:hypothetical protein